MIFDAVYRDVGSSLTNAVVVRAELKSLVTETLVRPECVAASPVIADVLISIALVDIDARRPVYGNLESRITYAMEAALNVTAHPVVAYSRSVVALVYVDTLPLIGSELVSVWTNALEVSLLVSTPRVTSAWVRRMLALIVVYTLMRIFVIDVPRVAQTLETSNGIYASPVGAHRRHHRALVDLHCRVGHRILYLPGFHTA